MKMVVSMPTNIHTKRVFAPWEVANAGYDEAERIQNASGMGINAPSIPGNTFGEYFARMMPWEVTAVIGQTHNGKTLFTDWWEHAICEQLKAEGRKDEVVVHVSLEESLEAMSFQQHSRHSGVPVSDIASGNVDLAKLRISVKQIAGVNIYRVADSVNTPFDAPPLTLSNIYRTLRELKSGNVTGEEIKISAVFVDYLQALPLDEEIKNSGERNKRRLQVRQDVFRLREMTVHLEAPIIVNVQAKQDLSNARPPYHIPDISDGSETSAIGERFDRVIGIWMPKVKHYRIGETVDKLGTIAEEDFYIRVNKQRGGFSSGKIFACKWNFKTRQLIDAYGANYGQKQDHGGTGTK